MGFWIQLSFRICGKPFILHNRVEPRLSKSGSTTRQWPSESTEVEHLVNVLLRSFQQLKEIRWRRFIPFKNQKIVWCYLFSIRFRKYVIETSERLKFNQENSHWAKSKFDYMSRIMVRLRSTPKESFVHDWLTDFWEVSNSKTSIL